MRWKRALLGDNPRALAFLLVPTAVALVLDVVLRGHVAVGWALQGKAIYGTSLLISAGFWVLPLWGAARVHALASGHVASDRRRTFARVALGAFFALWILPLATFCYGGQALYHRVVHAYMGRDTVRLGFALRGTVRDWFSAWGSSLALVAMILGGIVITIAIGYAVRRAAPLVSSKPPLVPAFAFCGALFCFWIDMVDSRFLQAALPDACFVHGFVHAVRVGVTGKGRTRRGISLRTPAKLPPIESGGTTQPKLDVLLVITESVRADALCSDPAACKARFLDEVAPDRLPLGRLTTPSPGTFSSCVMLWTGLPIDASVNDAHSAPVLWELARAAGYRTSYVTSQNLQFENFGAFVRQAGIDTLVGATELGGLKQEQLGAPDERATGEMLRVIRATPPGTPWFGVLHLSNTHAPYRVDPDLQPFAPHSPNPVGDVAELHNHYRNSVLLQERTVATFLRELRAMPGWDDTAVLFVSDHGEQFRERGGLYHLHNLYDEEVRIPGFIVAGSRALDADRRAALGTYAKRRTYLTDVHATVVDLLGLGAVRRTLLFASSNARSLLEKPGWVTEPLTLMSTATAVWDEDNVRNGVMLGDKLLVGAPGGSWTCFDAARDPGQTEALPAARCGRRMNDATSRFPP